MAILSDPIYRFYDLPAPLEEALKQFGAWSDAQLLAEQNDITPTVPLFHYTGREALLGILENRHLWCFSHDQQDDVDEFEYSQAIAIRELSGKAALGGQFAREFCICVDDLIKKNSFDVFYFFLFSFSQHRESARQWKKYGRDGAGFSIGFAPNMFAADQPLSSNPVENSHVGRVVYGDEKTAYRHRKVIDRAADITHRVGAANRSLLRSNSVHSDYINAMAKEYIARQFIWRCNTSKRACWSYQSEVRFVVINLRKKLDGYVKTHTEADGRQRQYIQHPLPKLREPGNITEIMVGSNAPNDAETWVRDQLTRLGYPAITVIRSTAVMP